MEQAGSLTRWQVAPLPMSEDEWQKSLTLFPEITFLRSYPLIGSDLKPSSVAIIREVYDSENAHIKFEMELERALEAGVSVIVIEPEPLGEETARWIYVGNILHKVSVYSGFCSIISGLAWRSLACTPFGIVSVLCAGCYTLSWQWDPCCKYQEEKDRRHLATLPVLGDLTSATPVVLVRKDNRKKVFFHNTVAITAAAVCLWRLYYIFK